MEMPLNNRPFYRIHQKRLRKILSLIKHARVAVMGDFCLDVYWMLDMRASEVSVETGKMTQPVREQRYSLGGAGNVAANLHDMGVGDIHTFGVVGNDPFGREMLSLLYRKAECSNMLMSDSESWQTLAYCKPYVDGEESQRIDMGNFNRLPDALANDLIGRLKKRLSTFDVVIINEQVASGIHTPFLRDRLSRLVSEKKEFIFVFDGRHVRDEYNGACLKMNDQEALKWSSIEKEDPTDITRDEVFKAIEMIFQKRGRPLVVTRGARGCVICDEGVIVPIPGIRVEGEIDTVGSGDSFLAGMTASLAVGATLEEAAQVGNLASAVTIRKIGQTGTATPEEILKMGASCRFSDESE